MSSWKDSVRRGLGAGALLLAVPALGYPETIADLADGRPGARPTTALPAPPSPLPGLSSLRFAAGRAPFATSRPFLRSAAPPSSAFETGGAAFGDGGFSDRLLTRMNREARRYRSENLSGRGGEALTGVPDAFDPAAEESRSDAASRVIVRSTRRALDEELERVARATLGLGPTLDLLKNLSFRRGRAAGSAEAAATRQPGAMPGATAPPARASADIGLRLDAHPALLFRARFGSLHGRLVVPARGEPLRLSVEAPVGPRGRAVLSSGLPGDGRGWATLVFNFGF